MRRVDRRSCRRSGRLLTGAVATVAICMFVGCGYTIGNGFPAEIRSVHVPVFTSDSFRRGYEIQLTEAVQKEIQRRTPFRLSDAATSDTVLRGHIVEIRKDVLGETSFDDPRSLQLSLAVEVTWEDRRTGEVLSQRQIPVPVNTVALISQSEFSPEVGHSLATSAHDVLKLTAEQVVDLMEMPW